MVKKIKIATSGHTEYQAIGELINTNVKIQYLVDNFALIYLAYWPEKIKLNNLKTPRW